MKLRTLILSLLLSMPLMATAANPVLLDAVEEYMDFSEYSSSLIWPEQIPEADWKKVVIIDARDAEQFAKGHIPGAINIEWRKVIARRNDIRKEGMVVVYCNSGSLSAQAVFALRLLGWDNVRVLQDGFEGWKAKGGFEANKRANQAAGH